jgi:hypothetical protein
VLTVARKELRTTEHPPGTNKTKYGAAYGPGDGEFWCGKFVWWVYREAGYDLRENGFSSPKSTNALDDDGRRAKGWTHVRDPQNAMPGDLVIFKFGKIRSIPGDTEHDADHCGIVSKRPTGNRIVSIDGNTVSDDDNEDNNGGGVFEVRRSFSTVKSIFRPPFGVVATLSPHQEIDMFLANVKGDDKRVFLVGIEGKRPITDRTILKELREAGIPYRENVSTKLLDLFPTLQQP